MDLFKNYQREFDAAIAQTSKKLGQLPTYTGERRKAFLREIENHLDLAKEAIDSMKHYAHTAYGGDSYLGAIRNNEREYERWLDEFRRASLGTGRIGSPPPVTDDWGVAIADQRTRLLQDRQRLAGTSDTLSETARLASETEAIGRNTLADLRRQREQLERGSSQLEDIDANVSRARKILTVMKRKVITNKLALIFIIIILLAAEGTIIWVRWIQPLINSKHPPSPSPAPTPAPVPAPVPAPAPSGDPAPSPTPSAFFM